MDGEGPERRPDDLEIEVSDLHAPSPHGGGAERLPWHRQRVELPRPVVAAAVVALVVLAVAAILLPSIGPVAALFTRPASTPTSQTVVQVAILAPATPTPSPSSYPTPTLIAPAIGPTPRDCPAGPAFVLFDPAAVGPGVGGPDVWLTAPFNTPHSTISLGLRRPSDYTPYGWLVQLQVFVTPGLAQTITLTGSDLRTHYPLWVTDDFAGDPDLPAAPAITIDSTQLSSTTSDGKWRIWFGWMYLPGAGCYTLQTSWRDGGWQVTFAAGR